jgi:hypothetical protein
MRNPQRKLISLLICFLMGLAPSYVGAQPASALAPAPIPAAFTQAPLAPPLSKDPGPIERARILESLGRMPLYFVENRGQMDLQVAYYVQGSDKTIYFAPDGVTFALTVPPDMSAAPALGSRWVVRLEFVGANPESRPVGEERTAAVISYFKGPQEEWHAGLATYSRIVYRDLWPGIDLVYYGTADRLKYEFIVQPGADPGQIRLAYHGATGVELTGDGQLQVTTPAGGFADDAPLAYQEMAGQRVPVAMAYALEDIAPDGPEQPSRRAYGFALGAYDSAATLVLDPAILVYCGYIGGSSNDSGTGIAVDGDGNAYVTGSTESSEYTFPAAGGPDLTWNGSSDAFVVKVRADGTGLVWAGYIGSVHPESGSGIAVDDEGNVYITGSLISNLAYQPFPAIVGPDLTYNGGSDAFVVKVRADGTALVYAGYIGGGDDDWGNGIAVDAAGNAYVTGYTLSDQATFPVAVGPDLTHNGGVQDAFVVKVRADGTGLVYAGYIGGSGYDEGEDIAVDDAGCAYVTGSTQSTEATFPVTVGPDLTYNGAGYSDAFVAKVRADGTGLVYAGFIGGSRADFGHGIDVDGAGNAYITGATDSSEATFPVTVGPDLTFNGDRDVFVAKVWADGTSLAYAGYIGGAAAEEGNDIAVDGSGNAYVTGFTYLSYGAPFPVSDGPDLTYNGGSTDAFVAKVRFDGGGLVYAGYIGGDGWDFGQGIAVDGAGSAYVIGRATSTDATFPVKEGPELRFGGGYDDAFVAKIAVVSTPTPAFQLYLPLLTTSTGSASARDMVTFAATGSMHVARGQHTATLLNNGKVLVAGGLGGSGGSLPASAELYDAATGNWTSTGSMSRARWNHSATLMNDGKVLVAGGQGSDERGYQVSLASAELYDPATGTWTDTGSMNVVLTAHEARLLSDGRVLAVGGRTVWGGGNVSSAELYDPTTGIWTVTSSQAVVRDSAYTVTLLKNGKVLVAGGYKGGTVLASSELFDPVAGIWGFARSMNIARFNHTATLLNTGRVLAVGGFKDGVAYGSAESYNPTTGYWSLAGNMADGRQGHTASLLSNGKVLVAGGNFLQNGTTRYLARAELYDPATGAWSIAGSMNVARAGHTAVLLNNEKVLVVGGVSGSGSTALASAELGTLIPGSTSTVYSPFVSED